MSEELARVVASRIRALLADRGMSGNALSKAAGIPQSSISRKLNDQAPFDLNDVQAIARALEVPVGALLPKE